MLRYWHTALLLVRGWTAHNPWSLCILRECK
uniref:Uncharacterized protein n=1 Tax=Zea mays TaxID=4577 RepID=B4FZI8_MAIZE|nr:unknown [Zea mays]